MIDDALEAMAKHGGDRFECTAVPVVCDHCRRDMWYATLVEGDRKWTRWFCVTPGCGLIDESEEWERHHLDVPHYGRIGSYWAEVKS